MAECAHNHAYEYFREIGDDDGEEVKCARPASEGTLPAGVRADGFINKIIFCFSASVRTYKLSMDPTHFLNEALALLSILSDGRKKTQEFKIALKQLTMTNRLGLT